MTWCNCRGGPDCCLLRAGSAETPPPPPPPKPAYPTYLYGDPPEWRWPWDKIVPTLFMVWGLGLILGAAFSQLSLAVTIFTMVWACVGVAVLMVGAVYTTWRDDEPS